MRVKKKEKTLEWEGEKLRTGGKERKEKAHQEVEEIINFS